jgi:Type I phosphodiesterase / nucleotide pyrophosphatase
VVRAEGPVGTSGHRGVAALAAGFLPGALAGSHLAGLIFFLNPALPFAAAPVLRGVALYGFAGGLASLVVLAPWTWQRAGRAWRLLPWTLTLAFALTALLYWTHASYFAYFLPPGINVRLIKAAVLVSLAALIGFYTALLHSVHRRDYGPRSRFGYALLAVATLYVMVERREAYRARPEPAPRPSAVESAQRPRLLVVGLAGATLDAVLPLAGQGRLPFFARIESDGAYGRLTSLSPFRPRALWTTLATGKLPYKHGVVGEEVYPAPFLGPGASLDILPVGMGFRYWGIGRGGARASDARNRRVLALWEAFPRLGLASGLVGWPASAPVSGETRFAVSDRFFTGDDDEPGAVRSEEEAERARLFRVKPEEIDRVVAARFGDDPDPEILAALAGDLWRSTLTLSLLDQNRDLAITFLELDGLAAVSLRDFGGYAAAQLEGVQSAEDQRSAAALAAYYAYLDGFLKELWDRTPPPKLLAVVSAYGAGSPEGWARLWREIERRPDVEGTFAGSPDGVLMLYGEGVREGSLLTGAQLVDLAPTLAYGLGVPVARDLDGRVLTAAFSRGFLARHPLTFLPSYETLTE